MMQAAMATGAIEWAEIHSEPFEQRDSTDPALRVLSWPFCPATTEGCGASYLWVEMGVSLDAYVARRNHGHDSVREIVDTTTSDLAPLVDALEDYFEREGIRSDSEKVATSQGLLQAVSYGFDRETGWTEYPKFGLEFLVDEQGDCDDAAIAHGVLLTELGYEAWFVRWRNATDPLKSGHMSTALTPTGDLASVTLPPGSVLVRGPEGSLLHADATGVIGGCTEGCTDLGWNEWHQRNLQETEVVRVGAEDLDERLGLLAWDNDGHLFPDRSPRDRRGDELEDLDEGDWEDRTRQRLKRMGEDEPEEILRTVRFEPLPNRVLYGLSGALGTGLMILAGLAWTTHTRRRAKAEKLKRERDAQRF